MVRYTDLFHAEISSPILNLKHPQGLKPQSKSIQFLTNPPEGPLWDRWLHSETERLKGLGFFNEMIGTSKNWQDRLLQTHTCAPHGWSHQFLLTQFNWLQWTSWSRWAKGTSACIDPATSKFSH